MELNEDILQTVTFLCNGLQGLIRGLINTLQRPNMSDLNKTKAFIYLLTGGVQGRWFSLLHDLIQVDHLPGVKLH